MTFLGPGTFTLNATGCGQGAILNVKTDGTVSVNSPENSAVPGAYLEIFATGLGPTLSATPDGYPAPFPNPSFTDPLYYNELQFGGTAYIANSAAGTWAGTAPGLVGVDQVNAKVPDTEGCAVPVRTMGGYLKSQAVLVSIHKGGGACVDPPSQTFGQVAVQRTIFMNSSQPETDVVTASFESAPWLQKPSSYPPYVFPPYSWDNRSELTIPVQQQGCPIPGDTFPAIGTVTAQTGQLNPVQATTDSTSGKLVYTATLPSGAIQGGPVQMSASGTGSIGAFQATVQVGSPIQITSQFPSGTSVDLLRPFAIDWTGGDSSEVVTITLLKKTGGLQDAYVYTSLLASDHNVVWQPVTVYIPGHYPDQQVVSPFAFPGHELQIVIDVAPAAGPGSFSAPGLTLGGIQTWSYEYRFTGLRELGN